MRNWIVKVVDKYKNFFNFLIKNKKKVFLILLIMGLFLSTLYYARLSYIWRMRYSWLDRFCATEHFEYILEEE